MNRLTPAAKAQRTRVTPALDDVYHALRAISPDAYATLARMILATATAERDAGIKPWRPRRDSRTAAVIRIVPKSRQEPYPDTAALTPRLRRLERLHPSGFAIVGMMVDDLLNAVAEAQ